jgi:hypothetical protein
MSFVHCELTEQLASARSSAAAGTSCRPRQGSRSRRYSTHGRGAAIVLRSGHERFNPADATVLAAPFSAHGLAKLGDDELAGLGGDADHRRQLAGEYLVALNCFCQAWGTTFLVFSCGSRCLKWRYPDSS